ncbi:30S ribosomal protein S13 [Candidatus Woesearchaeota archaeon]|nr:30S ribosomal protein S13 [Candidatus Woesearchaeota archaeon]
MADKSKSDYRHIVRVANTDLQGKKVLRVALTRIKGISYMYANMVCKLSGVDRDKKVGHLKNNEIEKIREVVENPENFDIPDWLKNRRKDFRTGSDSHLISGDLRFTQENDIKRLQKIKSYRGLRHAKGLPVRGQRTKSNFRRNKGKAVGVKRRRGAKSGRV